jgi:hypothetical protein
MQHHAQERHIFCEVPEAPPFEINDEDQNAVTSQILPPSHSSPELDSCSMMEIDQANSKTSDEPIGSTKGAMATSRHHEQKDSSQEATKGTASHGIEDVNQSTVLAQISSWHQPNTFTHPDSGNTINVDGANMGKSGKSGTTHLDQDNTMNIDEANGKESGQHAETSNNSVPVNLIMIEIHSLTTRKA